MKLKRYIANQGKIWKSKVDGAYLSNILILGSEDTIDSYEQVDPPIVEDDET